MRYYDYSFEDIPVKLRDRSGMASGTMCVSYIMTRPDPSVGYRGGPEIVDHSDLRVTIIFDDAEDEVCEIPSGDMQTLTLLLRQIVEYIDQAYIYDEIEQEHGAFW